MMVWDPSAIAFYIPLLKHPVTWYGLLFAGGFWIGLSVFRSMFRRFLTTQVIFQKGDVRWEELKKRKEFAPLSENNPKSSIDFLKNFLGRKAKGREKELEFVEKAHGEEVRSLMEARFYLEEKFPTLFQSLENRVRAFSDSLLIYAILGTVIGARLAHVFFYENPLDYLLNPIDILKTWEGGLASHGGILGLMLAMVLFYRKMRRVQPTFSLMKLLDYMAVPTMLVCSMIRIGNFMNQEILGKATNLPWGIVFGHPADGSDPVARHPVQLYEWFFYFSMYLTLYILWKKSLDLWRPGRLIGIAVFGSFLFRFFIEYWKIDDTYWLQSGESSIIMGQLLSIPLMILGLYFLFLPKGKKSFTN